MRSSSVRGMLVWLFYNLHHGYCFHYVVWLLWHRYYFISTKICTCGFWINISQPMITHAIIYRICQGLIWASFQNSIVTWSLIFQSTPEWSCTCVCGCTWSKKTWKYNDKPVGMTWLNKKYWTGVNFFISSVPELVNMKV